MSRQSRSACWGRRRLSKWWRRLSRSPHSRLRARAPSEAPSSGAIARSENGRSFDALSPPLPQGEGRAFIVYDPVMTASSGDPLSGAGFVETVRASLLPLVDCLTPNLAEAAALLGERIARSEADMARQGEALLKLGPRAVLMKGGHLEERGGDRPAGDRRRCSPFRGAEASLQELARNRLHALQRHRRQYRSRRPIAGGCGGGQGFRSPSDRARRGRCTGLGSGAADPDRAPFETLTHSTVFALVWSFSRTDFANMAGDFYETIPVLDVSLDP